MLAGLRSAVQGFLVDLPETFSVDFGQTIQSDCSGFVCMARSQLGCPLLKKLGHKSSVVKRCLHLGLKGSILLFGTCTVRPPIGPDNTRIDYHKRSYLKP